LKALKYVLLAYLLIIPPLIAHAGLHSDFKLPFCRMICPAKPLMPLFAGDFHHLALDFTNIINLLFTVSSVIIAAGMLAGMFFKERFFCLFCPMLVLIHLFRKISPVRFEKDIRACTGCGNCQRMCPMDIRNVHMEKSHKNVLSEDCLLCMSCMEACPANGVLSLRFFKWRLFSSSRQYTARRFIKREQP
jgi:ferredoxin-type protein NapH